MRTRLAALVLSWFLVGVGRGDDRPDLYLVSIGVEPDCTAKGKLDPYARDAEFVARTFEAARPLYRNVVPTVLNGRNATADKVQTALRDVSSRIRPNDVCVVFFSCHGGTDPATGYAVSLFQPGNRKEPWGSLSGAELRSVFNGMNGRVAVFVDTCGAAGLIPPPREGSRRVAYITACAADGSSAGGGDSVRYPHGFFVVAMVEALRGLADANKDGVVTLREVENYLPTRASSIAPEQTAVLQRRPACADIPLAKNDMAMKAPFNLDGNRNPFGLPDTGPPSGRDVLEFARSARIPGGANDPNAEQWNNRSFPGKAESIDGMWQSRWNSGGEWTTGMARIRVVNDRVYILYTDRGSRYLIEARKGQSGRLVGRYSNINAPEDSTPWVGRIIGPDRIDGVWSGGRWDFRRTIQTP